jgi:hypothetical protein
MRRRKVGAFAPELLERWARRISRGDLCNLEAVANAPEGIGAFMV